jgi:hypothetical protein
MKYFIIASLFFCLKIYSFEQNFLLQRFAEQLEQSNFPRAFEWLRMWGDTDPTHHKIASALEDLISEPQAFHKAEKKLDRLLRVGNISAEDTILIKNLQKLTRSDGLLLCSANHEDSPFRQPYPDSVKYWTCVTGVLAGIVMMPFAPSVGGFLLTSAGTFLLLDVVPTLVGNKMEYNRSKSEKDSLNLSQQILSQIQLKLKHLDLLTLSAPIPTPLSLLKLF